jgi:hypothetical protein
MVVCLIFDGVLHIQSCFSSASSWNTRNYEAFHFRLPLEDMTLALTAPRLAAQLLSTTWQAVLPSWYAHTGGRNKYLC